MYAIANTASVLISFYLSYSYQILGNIVGHTGIPCIQKMCILCTAYILDTVQIVRVR